MCGIVGCAGLVTAAAERAFRDMLVFDSVRGEDSTGVAFLHQGMGTSIVKEVGDPFVLLTSGKFNRAMKGVHKAILGHNRWATTGKINRDNAHPFETDNLIGVHNGTLKNKSAIPNHLTYETDSEALYNHIDNVGVEKAIPIIDGAWALVWIDKNEGTISFLRNKERPMYIGFSEDEKTMLWASEAWMLTVAASRNNIKIKYKELAVDMLHTFEIPLNGTAFKPATVKEVKGKEEDQKKTITTVFTGSTGLGIKAGQTVEIIGIKTLKNKQDKWYLECIEADNWDGGDVYRIYDDFDSLQKYMVGRWTGLVSYSVKEGNNTQYHKINNNTLHQKKKDKPVEKTGKEAFITKEEFNKKYPRCCNCNQKLEFSEEFKILDKEGCLCEQCNTEEILKIINCAF